MNIKGFLFDVDGVLYDSMPQHARSWIGAFKKKKLKITARNVYFCEGMRDSKAAQFLASTIKRRLTKHDQEEIIVWKQELFNGYKKPRLIKGAKQLLGYLAEHGYKLCLVTGSSQQKTLRIIAEDFGVQKRAIITGAEVANGKPHPEPYLKGLQKLKLRPTEVIAIENAPLGITSAKRARLYCIVLKTGHIPSAILKRSGADRIFKDCADLLTYLSKNINSKHRFYANQR